MNPFHLHSNETPKIVADILDSFKTDLEKSRQEYGKKVSLENSKMINNIKKALDSSVKSGDVSEVVMLKSASDNANNGDILKQILYQPDEYMSNPSNLLAILETERQMIEKAKIQYSKNVTVINEKIIAQIKKSLDDSLKTSNAGNTNDLKPALEKAEKNEYLNEMLNLPVEDLLNYNNSGGADDDAVIFTKKRIDSSLWKLQGDAVFVKDQDFRGIEILSLNNNCLVRENYEAIRNGPLFMSMWVKYQGGKIGSFFGIAQENRDEASVIVTNDGKVGTFSGWPNAGIVTSKYSIKQNQWMYLACQWDKAGMTIYIDGKEVDKIKVPALENRQGRLEIGVNSPGGDEYLNMMIASFRIKTGKVITAEMVSKYMQMDKQKVLK